METEAASYREEERLWKRTKEIFQGTKYQAVEKQVRELLKKKRGKKLYVNALRIFGREDDLERYRKIREECCDLDEI